MDLSFHLMINNLIFIRCLGNKYNDHVKWPTCTAQSFVNEATLHSRPGFKVHKYLYFFGFFFK